MDHADMPLRRSQIAGVLEGDPGMTGLEQHGQHAPPEIGGPHRLEDTQAPGLGLGFIGLIGGLEIRPIEVVQIGRLVRREKRPFAVLRDPLHEQIRHPIGRVHVVGAAAVVAGVLAQVEELLDVDVPGLEVGADRALALGFRRWFP